MCVEVANKGGENGEKVAAAKTINVHNNNATHDNYIMMLLQ